MRESVPSGVLTSVLRPAFIASALAWALLLPLAPFVAARPLAMPLGGVFVYAVYVAGSAICHQLPERSFHLWSQQMPVCARCTGIYVGAAVAAIAARPHRRRSITARRWRAILAAAAAPAVLSLLYEWTTGRMPSHWTRAATGVPLGAVVAALVIWATRPGAAAENQGKLTGRARYRR
jgi:uncharacterized membrane protein